MFQLEYRPKRSHNITSGAKAMPIARALPALVWPAGQPDDLGYGRGRLIVRPVGIHEDKGSANDVLDLN
jgi:hypothetical protein